MHGNKNWNNILNYEIYWFSMKSTKWTFSIRTLQCPHTEQKTNKDAVAFHSEFQLPLHQNKLNAITKGSILFSMNICEKKKLSKHVTSCLHKKNILNNLWSMTIKVIFVAQMPICKRNSGAKINLFACLKSKDFFH